MIIVTGAVRARPESFERALEVCLEHTHRSRGEPGCISHDVHIDAEDPLKLVFLERWTDRGALQVHFQVPASNDFMREIRELAETAAPLQIFQAEIVR